VPADELQHGDRRRLAGRIVDHDGVGVQRIRARRRRPAGDGAVGGRRRALGFHERDLIEQAANEGIFADVEDAKAPLFGGPQMRAVLDPTQRLARVHGGVAAY